MNDSDLLREFFAKLELDPRIADVYLALSSNGPQTMSELSRSSGIERTLLYRLADDLLASSLIEVEAGSVRHILRAAPINNLRILVAKREQELQSVQKELGMIERLFANNRLESPASRIQTYQGSVGIKQMLWNETKASSTIYSILYENIQTRTDRTFFERWADACNQRKLSFRAVVGKRFLDSQDTWYKGAVKERLEDWKYRTIDDTVFPIPHTTIIYDNVVGYFNWKNDQIYGMEIYNPDIAASQRQLFKMLWQQAAEPITG